MITQAFCNLVVNLMNAIMNVLDLLPSFPETLVTSIDSFFDLLFSNLSLISFFVHIDVIKILIPLWIVIDRFEDVYRGIMWILRKVPFVGIE